MFSSLKSEKRLVRNVEVSNNKKGKGGGDKHSDSSELTFWIVFVLVSCVKFLLIPTYHSTDFEVHRNWLAITHSLPLREWYVNEGSQWTLDYPPFFAWFEYILSHLAKFFDPKMLEVDNLEYASFETKIFQRSSVILADTVFAYGVKEISGTFYRSESSSATLSLLALSNIGLLIVDHVHFQYNGFLLGILMLAISKVSNTSNENQVLCGAFWFSVLLNLKHIYIYVAPAFIVWLLRSYCFKDGKYISRIFKLGTIVLLTVAASFGPFMTQLPQVLSRLFPFKRGMVHAYWAANAWALYTGLDKVLAVIWRRFGWSTISGTASMTGGLVQEFVYAVLPTPTPLATFLITFISMIPGLWMLLTGKNFRTPLHFTRCVVLCGLTSFMFGWHVHEKAILTAIVPLCALSTIDALDAKVFIILSAAGHTALLPLLHQVSLGPLRLLLLLFYTLLSVTSLVNLHKKSLLRYHEWFYVGILPLLPIYENCLHGLIFGVNLPFLPLALVSLYCAVGVTYSWIYYYLVFMRDWNSLELKMKT